MEEQTPQEESIQESKENPYLVPGAIVLAGAFIAAAVIYTNGGGSALQRAGQKAFVGNGAGEEAIIDMEKIQDDDPFLGDPAAPVTIVEFSDFECPFCKRFASDTEPKIIENYVKTGKVKFVYRDFPLSAIHASAQKAAEAAECADDHGRFWPYHDRIFENQQNLSEANLKTWAVELGVDANTFNQCLDSGKYKDEVAKDLADGQALGVSGTPTFFINGVRLVGALPYSQFEQVIEAALKK